MEDMKSDMTGAAVVVATMQAAARLAIAGQLSPATSHSPKT